MTFFSPCGPIARLAFAHGVSIAGDFFAADDAAALTAREAMVFARRPLESRRASGAARRLARGLLARQGATFCDILVDGDGAPLWPDGFCGSLAHDSDFAVAAIARGKLGLGVDVEPDAPLPKEAITLVTTPDERARYDIGLRGREIFVVKEACFKALFPQDRKFREFCDVEVDLDAGRAWSQLGGACRFAIERGAKIVALAVRQD